MPEPGGLARARAAAWGDLVPIIRDSGTMRRNGTCMEAGQTSVTPCLTSSALTVLLLDQFASDLARPLEDLFDPGLVIPLPRADLRRSHVVFFGDLVDRTDASERIQRYSGCKLIRYAHPSGSLWLSVSASLPFGSQMPSLSLALLLFSVVVPTKNSLNFSVVNWLCL